ncbi:MAG: NAD(P)/FAD-dependent oxidoreductase [Endomicrobiales bacterium]|nr:NAD(P)/FAD-dependent oxidoreductase [Endomicrobiales bacterium]
MDKVDITIIGAGVVGLACAARLSKGGRSIFILEKNAKFGQESSSRNSEVVHSGVYYNSGSLKASLCVRGNPMIYEYCRKTGVKHERLGKIVVACEPREKEDIEKLKEKGETNGVQGLKLLTGREVRNMEPELTAVSGLLVPSTGIFDTHSFMSALLGEAKDNGAEIMHNAEVSRIEKTNAGYGIKIKNEDFEFETGILVNCAGLNSDKICALAGIDVAKEGYKLHYCKGEYFRTRRPLKVRRLVYPSPEKNFHSLGIHLTPDLAGGTRFGPDAFYVDKNDDYSMDESRKPEFLASINKYLPSITLEELLPDTVGIRAKLQGPKDDFRDFLIRNEKDKGFEGFINLVGIESPGLTSSLAIAEYVEKLL